MPLTRKMDTGTCSLRKTLRKGSCRACPFCWLMTVLLFLCSSCLAAFLVVRPHFCPGVYSITSDRTLLTDHFPQIVLTFAYREVITAVKGVYIRITAQPGDLSLGKLARRRQRLIDHFTIVDSFSQVIPHLPITHTTNRWHRGLEIAARIKFLNFRQKTLLQHGAETLFDTGVQFLSVLRPERDFNETIRQRNPLPGGSQLAQGLAGEFVYFKRALNALRIVRMDPLRGFCINSLEPPVPRLPSRLRRLGIQAFPDFRVGGRQIGKPELQRMKIEHGAANQQRYFAGARDRLHLARGIGAEFRR